MLPQDEQGNLSLLISNQSYYINPVDIKVSIDCEVAVREEFDVQGNQLPQHNWQQFRFKLENGKHTIAISSVKGDANFESTFEVTGFHIATIAYWYYPNIRISEPRKYFTFEIRKKPVGYM